MSQAGFFERHARVLAAAARTAATSHDANAFRKLATCFEAQSLRESAGGAEATGRSLVAFAQRSAGIQLTYGTQRLVADYNICSSSVEE